MAPERRRNQPETIEEGDKEGSAVAAEDRIRQTGRNDPCWCGSGKKYKVCHLAQDEAEERNARSAQPVSGGGPFEEVRRSLVRLAERAVRGVERQAAFDKFFGSAMEAREEDIPAFVEWLIFDWQPSRGGKRLIEQYADSEGRRLPAPVREALQTWARAVIDLYKVQGVEEGKGVHLQREATGERLFVHDVSSSRQLVRGDYLLSRVVVEDAGFVFNADGLRLPRGVAEELTGWMQEEQRRLGLEREDFLRHHWPDIRRFIFESVRASWEAMRLTNSDGEPFELHDAIYEVQDEAALRAALAGRKEIHESGEGAWVWLRGNPDEPGNTILGSLSLSGGRLKVSCNSSARMKRGKALLQEAAGARLRHLGDKITSLEELKRQAAKPDTNRQEEPVPPELEKAMIEKVLEHHYSTWPDVALPALGGKTPREAVRTASGRREVERLLEDFANAAAHDRREGRPAYDFSRLRRELGLS